MRLLEYVPCPPNWTLDWDGLNERLPDLRRLKTCPQDPVWHAEGNVWVHTRMVLEALVAMPEWRGMPDRQRQIVFLAALLHDIGKVYCTKTEEDGRITSRGHSRRGAVDARKLLWRLGVPFVLREAIAGIIQYHQIPFFLLDRADSRRLALRTSLLACNRHLALHAIADARGRICEDQAGILGNVELFEHYCEELGCLDGPYPFPDAHTRFSYFRSDGRPPDVPIFDVPVSRWCSCQVFPERVRIIG